MPIHDTFITLQDYNDNTTNNNKSVDIMNEKNQNDDKILQYHNNNKSILSSIHMNDDENNKNGDKTLQHYNYKSIEYPIMNKECFNYFYVVLWTQIKTEWIIPKRCVIDINSSYSLYFRINNTLRRRVSVIQSLNEWDKSKYYIIKTYSNRTERQYQHFQEYKYMSYLTQFCNDINDECHTYKVDNQYPLINLTVNNDNYTIVFMEYLLNTMTYQEFVRQLFNNNNYTISDKINFINDCLMNVTIVLDQLWQKSILHNDLHPGNILVSNKYPNNCYLIDFNRMFHLTKNEKDRYYGFEPYQQNPFLWYYLGSHHDRNKYLNKANNSFDTLKKYGYQTQRYRIYIYILDTLMSFFKKKLFPKLNDENVITYFEKLRRTVVKTKDDINNIWCCRMEEIIYIIQILKQYGYTINNDNTIKRLNVLQNMYKLYYQLRNELLHFNIICNKCMLLEQFQELHLKSPILNLSKIFHTDKHDIIASVVEQSMNTLNHEDDDDNNTYDHKRRNKRNNKTKNKLKNIKI